MIQGEGDGALEEGRGRPSGKAEAEGTATAKALWQEARVAGVEGARGGSGLRLKGRGGGGGHLQGSDCDSK